MLMEEKVQNCIYEQTIYNIVIIIFSFFSSKSSLYFSSLEVSLLNSSVLWKRVSLTSTLLRSILANK